MDRKNIIIVPLRGKIASFAECQKASRLIDSYLHNDGNLLVLDFSLVEEVSGSFLGFLSGNISRVHDKNKQLAIVDPSGSLREVLEYSGIRGGVSVHESFEDFEHQTNRSQAILIIDDEAMMRDVTGEFAQQMGFQVLTAASGEDGVELFRRNGARILLVILDLQMPAMSGEETLTRLREIDPEVKVIVVTGCGDAERVAYIQSGLGVQVMCKPFMLEDLEEVLSKTLMLV
jgi:CheY-like chemotaxis protein/anti-anti-sigma regulatory factor